ncbi:MAG: TlpA family protein disulfide reductase [Chitinophagales bacterium]
MTNTLSIDVENPLWGKLSFNDQSLPLYLEKGYHLKISPSELSSLQFKITGRGAEINAYLFEVQKLEEQLFNKEPNINTLPISEFKKEINAFKLALNALSETLLSTKDLLLVEKMMEVKFLQYDLMHQMVRHDLFKDERLQADELKALLAPIAQNFDLFDLQFLDYGAVLSLFMDAKIYHSFWREDYSKSKALTARFHKLVEDSLVAMNLENNMLELLKAKNIENALLRTGINPSSQVLYEKFEVEYKNSAYFPDLKAEYNQLSELQVNNLAPEIIGITPGGKEISLGDLKGSVVYVDVWATWCKPCIAEFPHSKELMKKYDERDVSFVYCSIDSDRNAWLQFLEKDKDFGGVHLIEKEEGKILESYQIIGVPRYILIDSEGKLVDSDAPKPSSGKVESLIDGLLN